MQRRYSLYEKVDGKWTRLSDLALTKPSAIRHFQSQLLSGYFEGKHLELRPVQPRYQITYVDAGVTVTLTKTQAERRFGKLEWREIELGYAPELVVVAQYGR